MFLDKILEIDTELFLFLNNLGCECSDWFWLFITGKYSSIPIYLLLFFLMKRNNSWKSFGISLLLIIVLIAIIDMSIDDIIRPFFKRLRPYKVIDHNLFRLIGSSGGTYGFFSAHAANSFGFAIIIYLYLKDRFKYVWTIFIWAFITAYSRIYLGVHYPSDIIFGIIYGLFIGYLVYRVRLLIKI